MLPPNQTAYYCCLLVSPAHGSTNITKANLTVKRGLELNWSDLFAGSTQGGDFSSTISSTRSATTGRTRLSLVTALAVVAMERPESNCARNDLLLIGNIF